MIETDNVDFMGESLSLFEINISTNIISIFEVYAAYFTPQPFSHCLENSLNTTKARGKISDCQYVVRLTDSKLAKWIVVGEAGGVCAA